MKIHIIVLTLMFGASSFAYACDGSGGRHNKGYSSSKAEFLQSMTQEERAEFKAVRDKFKNMSKKERHAFKASVKSKWTALSETEKSDFIRQHQQQIDKILTRQKEKAIIRVYGAQLMKNNDQ